LSTPVEAEKNARGTKSKAGKKRKQQDDHDEAVKTVAAQATVH